MSALSMRSSSLSPPPSKIVSLEAEKEEPKKPLGSSLCGACQDRLAITIQKCARGHLARKPLLRGHSYHQYSIECEKATKAPDLIPQASTGRTRVYLPQAMPDVVLKFSGREQAIRRFGQMHRIRALLELQKSSHLIVPQATLCQNFLVEERLPVNVDWYHNMGLYLSQPQLFDEAVREFTRLFSRVFIRDLVHPQLHPLAHIEGVQDFVRSDNIPFYIVEKNGKKVARIGLIDLEQCVEKPNLKGLETLVRIFPLHLKLVVKEATTLKIEMDKACLKRASEKGKKYLQVAYTDHLQWLRQRGFSHHVSLQSFRVNPKRIQDLIPIITNALLLLNQGINDVYLRKYTYETVDRNFFVGNAEEIARELAVCISPLLIKNIQNEIHKQRKIRLEKLASKLYLTDSERVSLRSPVLQRKKLYNGVLPLIKDQQKAKKINILDGTIEIAEQLLKVVLQEFVKGGEIFSFDPAYYSAGHDSCWIRY